MKISELKEKRIIRRPTRTFDAEGNRIYNVFEYDFPYNPSYQYNERERLFAKIIDILPFFVVILYTFSCSTVFTGFIFSIPSVIISGTICETYWGTTLGKKVFRIKVLDDSGDYPDLLLSLKRNILCICNLWPVFTDYIPPPHKTWENEFTKMNFSMDINNKLCKTYIVKEKKIKEIKELLQQENNKKNS
jgi:hypothetical protein